MFRTSEAHSNGVGDAPNSPIHYSPVFWTDTSWLSRKSSAFINHVAEKPIETATYMQRNDKYSCDDTVRRSSIISIILRYVLVLLAFLSPLVTLTLTLSVPKLYSSRADNWENSFTHCDYDGTFTPYDTPSKSLWDRDGFFDINVAWGKMEFSTAKFIDIVWDIVVGRMGQALIACVTFKVTSQYLAMAMHEGPVSYTTFEALAFVPPSLVVTGRLAGDLLRNRGWRARLVMVWILFSSFFVISFSSLATAMSGYSSDTNAVMPNYDGIDAVWGDYEIVQFAINDAWRVGEPGPVIITGSTSCAQQGLSSNADDDDDDGGASASTYRRRNKRDGDGEDDPWKYVPFNCTLFWRTVQYVKLYGLRAARKESSTLTLDGVTHNLTSPALNITTSYTPASISLLSSYLDNFFTESAHVLDPVNKVSRSTFWIHDNQTYSYEYVMDHATCSYTGFHKWGFSFSLLFITTLLLGIWAIGTYVLWLYVYLHGPRDATPGFGVAQSSGIYRSSWALVEAMKRDVGPDVVTSGMTERDIRSLIRRRPERANGIEG